MKNLIGPVAGGVTLLAALTACTNASESAGAAGDDLRPTETASVAADPAVVDLVPQEFKDQGSITVAMDASYPPFQFFDADNLTIIGFDADFASAVAQKMGLEAELQNVGFDTILTGLAGGRYDLGESSFSITPEREEVVDFVSYLQGGAGIAVTPGNPLGLEMDPMALCGYAIAAQKGTTQAIEQLPAISEDCVADGEEAVDVKLFPSQNDAVLALTSGRVDGMMADSTAVSYQAELSGGKFELAPGDIYESRPTGIALPKGSELQEAVSAAVVSLYEDGTVEELAEKWSIPATNFDPHPGQ